MLVLEAPARQTRQHGGGGRAVAHPRPQHLERVGGEADGSPQRTHDQPGVSAADRQVLPRRHEPATLRVFQRREVDVLADVVLVQPDGVLGCQAHVLHQQEVQPLRLRRVVGDLHVPEPDRRVGRQPAFKPHLQALPGSAGRPGPSQRGRPRRRFGWRLKRSLLGRRTRPKRRARPQQRYRLRHGFAPVQPQPQLHAAGLEGRSRVRVEHDAMALAATRRAVGHQFEAQAGIVAEQGGGGWIRGGHRQVQGRSWGRSCFINQGTRPGSS